MREERIDRIVRRLKHHAPEVPIFESVTEISGFTRVSGRLRVDVQLFGESTGRVLIACEDADAVLARARAAGVPARHSASA